MGRGGWGRVRDGQRELGGVGEEHGVPCTTIVLRSASEKLYILEYVRKFYAKIGVRVTVYIQLLILVMLSLEADNPAFILTPKSAVKSCR